jgi:phosphotransferase system  glucose/maltose/N-acetylglucosamine-specific IIC component
MKTKTKQQMTKSGRAIVRAAAIVLPVVVGLEIVARLVSHQLAIAIGGALLVAVLVFLAKWSKD